MAAGEIHVGDVVRFESNIKNGSSILDISPASTKLFIFEDPNGNVLTFSGSFLTDGTDGVLTYKTSTSDLSVAGRWRYQIFVVIADNENHSDITSFRVKDNLPI